MLTDPLKNALEFGFLPGQVVADFGAGSGHYSLALSKLLGPEGRVYAVDIREEPLIRLKKLVEEAGRENLEVLVGDIDEEKGSMLRDSCVDGVVIANLLFQLEKPEGAVRETKRVLKPGGRVCVVEHKDKFESSKVKEIFLNNGFSLKREIALGGGYLGAIFTITH